MTTSPKPTRSHPKAKSKKPKAPNAAADARSRKKVDIKGKRRDVVSIVADLDISSLNKDEIADVLVHLASALNLRKIIDTPEMTLTESSANYCYTKSGSSSTVSIWSGGFKVGETSEANAKASGIPSCG
jgi:hypothetical protein